MSEDSVDIGTATALAYRLSKINAIKYGASNFSSFQKKSENADGSQTWTITWINNGISYPYDIKFPKGVSAYQGVYTSKTTLETTFPTGLSPDKFAIVDESSNVYLANFISGTWNYKRLNNKIVIKKDSTNTNLCYRFDDQTDTDLQVICPITDIKGDKGDQGNKISHKWTNTILSLENPDGTFDGGVDLKGLKGAAGTQLNPKNAWNSTINYVSNSDIIDLVNYNGKAWIALSNNINKQPDVSPYDWALFYDNTVQGGLTAEQELLINSITNKQNITENTLTTTNKNIPLSINELNNNIKTVLTPHLTNYANPHKTTIALLNDILVVSPNNGDALVYDNLNQKWKNGTVSTSDEKVKMASTDTSSSYLTDLLDGSTIQNINGKLTVKNIDGVTVSKDEVNRLAGLDDNIMTKFSTFLNGGIVVYTLKTFATYAELLTFDFTTLTTGKIYTMYVNIDETHSNNGTTYMCDHTTNSTTNLPKYLGLSSATQRVLATDKVDLTSEVKNVLPLANMDVSTLATKTEVNAKTQINDSGITGDITDTYSIDKILTLLNTKQNKVFIQEIQPTDLTKDNLWIDITINSTGHYKFYRSDGTKYNEIGSSASASDGILTTPTESIATIDGQDTFIVATHAVNSGTLLIFVEGDKLSNNDYIDIDTTHIQLNTSIKNTIQKDMVVSSLVIAKSNGIDIWISGTNYLVGKLVIYNNAIYQCKIAHTDTVFTISNWQLIGSVFDLKDYVDNTKYPVGIYVIHDKNIFRCIVESTDISWTATHWELIGGYIIQDNLGSYAKRTNLKLIGNGVKIKDDSINDTTIISIDNSTITSIMTVSGLKPTVPGYYIFTVIPSDSFPSVGSLNDILYLDDKGTWNLFQTYINAPSTMTIGINTNSQIIWKKQNGTWVDTTISSYYISELKVLAGYNVPTGWLQANGQSISRSTYNNLFNTITFTISITNAAGSNIVTVLDTSMLCQGFRIEIDGVGYTINTITNGTQFVVSSNIPSAHTSISVLVLPHGALDINNFNVPNTKGRTIFGVDNTQTDFKAIGKTGGNASIALKIENLPSHNHNYFSADNWTAKISGWSDGTETVRGSAGSFPNTSNTGSNTPFSILNPYFVGNYIIKY